MKKICRQVYYMMLALAVMIGCLGSWKTKAYAAESIDTKTTYTGSAHYSANSSSTTTDTYDFNYTIGDQSKTTANDLNTAVLTKYNVFNKGNNVTIPTTVKVKIQAADNSTKTYTLKVTEVGNGSSLITNSSLNLNTVKIGNNVTKINAYAFNNKSITTLQISKPMTISSRAFAGNEITTATISAAVTFENYSFYDSTIGTLNISKEATFGSYSFANSDITTATISAAATFNATTFRDATIDTLNLTKEIENHNGAFSGDNRCHITHLKATGKTIYKEMFKNNTDLLSVDLSNGAVDYIQEKAFWGCTGLSGKNVIYNNNGEETDEPDAYNITDWSTIKLNNGLKEVGDNAFNVLGQDKSMNSLVQELFENTKAGITQNITWANDEDHKNGILTVTCRGFTKDGLLKQNKMSSPVDMIVGMDLTYSQKDVVTLEAEKQYNPCFHDQVYDSRGNPLEMNNNPEYCTVLTRCKKNGSKTNYVQFEVSKKLIFDTICDLKRTSPNSRVGFIVTMCTSAEVLDINTKLGDITWDQLKSVYESIEPDTRPVTREKNILVNTMNKDLGIKAASKQHGGASDYYGMGICMFEAQLSRTYLQPTVSFVVGDFEDTGGYTAATSVLLTTKSYSEESYAINILSDREKADTKAAKDKLTHSCAKPDDESHACFVQKGEADSFYSKFQAIFDSFTNRIELKANGIDALSLLGSRFEYNSRISGKPTNPFKNSITTVGQSDIAYNENWHDIFQYKIKIKDSYKNIDGNTTAISGGSLQYILYNKDNIQIPLDALATDGGHNIYWDTWTLNYDGNGNTGGTNVEPTYRHWCEEAVFSDNTFTKKGYVFIGWKIGDKVYKPGDVWMGSASNPNAGTSANKVITAYAQWRPIEYDIYYEKGLTDDTQNTSIANATRNTDIQSTGKNRPYTHCKYDSPVSFATIGTVLGRNYTLSFNKNKPASIVHQKSNHDADPTAAAPMTGNLSSKDQWQITGQEEDVTSNLTPTMGATIESPNYVSVDNGSVTATALWQNKLLDHFSSPTLTGWKFVGWYDNQEGKDSTAVSNTTDMIREVNKETNVSPDTSVTVKGNVTSYTVQPKTTKFDQTLYARWQRTIHLTFDMNGGEYRGDPSDVILNGIYYNNADGYNFSLTLTPTAKHLPDYEEQQNRIDAYGTYDSNGENAKYTKTDDKGVVYRFLGWSLNKDATEPDSSLIVYDAGRAVNYRVYDDTTLYAVWEPVLIINFNLDRTLGNLNFSDGSSPDGNAANIRASSGTQYVSTIAKPGEQCNYSITFKGRIPADAYTSFDPKITDIYTHSGSWTDNLNPSTGYGDPTVGYEDLIESQQHGLDRHIIINNNYIQRKFYVPQYLGTKQSYETSIDITQYSALFEITQPSFYYKYVYNKLEQVEIAGTIYITTSKSTGGPDGGGGGGDPTPVISVLDELRAKLKIRLK